MSLLQPAPAISLLTAAAQSAVVIAMKGAGGEALSDVEWVLMLRLAALCANDAPGQPTLARLVPALPLTVLEEARSLAALIEDAAALDAIDVRMAAMRVRGAVYDD